MTATTPTTSAPERDSATGFLHVDRTGDPGFYVRFLEGASSLEQVGRLKHRT